MAIDAIEAAIQANPTWDRRPVIAHVELIDDVDLARMAKLGITALMQPLWARRDGLSLSCLPALGEERFERLYRAKDLLEQGVRLAMGSDWPVSSPDPLLGIYTAVSRTVDASSEPLGLAQAITVEQALQSYVQESAYVLGQEQHLDRDWVELSEDPSQVPIENIKGIKILRASVAGRIFEF
jgi:predicted amidohydrolase YtcJ